MLVPLRLTVLVVKLLLPIVELALPAVETPDDPPSVACTPVLGEALLSVDMTGAPATLVALAGPPLTVPVYVDEDPVPIASENNGDVARTSPEVDSAFNTKSSPYVLAALVEIIYDPNEVETSVATTTFSVRPPDAELSRTMLNVDGSEESDVQLKVMGCVGSSICPSEGDLMVNALVAARKPATEIREMRILNDSERVEGPKCGPNIVVSGPTTTLTNVLIVYS